MMAAPPPCLHSLEWQNPSGGKSQPSAVPRKRRRIDLALLAIRNDQAGDASVVDRIEKVARIVRQDDLAPGSTPLGAPPISRSNMEALNNVAVCMLRLYRPPECES